MGRLLIRLQQESIHSFEDAIKPKNFYKVIVTVRDMAGFHEMTQCYRTPSLAVKMGYSLKKMGSIILAGTDVNEQVKRDTKTFMRLCSKEWSESICHAAVLCVPKVKNPSTIPFTRDMQVFYNYLEATSASAIESMKTNESQEAYIALCKVTLAQASVLNKCAPEVSKMTLKTFQERDDTTKVLSKNFMRMNILSSRTDELEPDGEQYDSENSDAEEDEEESDHQQSDVVVQQAAKKKQKRQLTPEQDESFEDAAASSAESCSDDEYKPDCDPSSDESCTSTYIPPPKRSKKDPDSGSSKRRRFEQRPTNASFTQQEHWSESDHSSDDDFSSDGDDIAFKDPTHTNKNYCYVCGKAMIKLSRHLFTHRKKEPDIAEAFVLPPGSKERFALLEKLRNKGNLKHNEEVIKTNRGELKVKRKKSNQFTGIQTFAQCLYCKGMYSRQVMWRHMQKCSLKKTKETKCKKQRKIKVLTLVAAAESTDLMSSQVMNLEEILKKLKNDEIASVVKNDTHILQLAQCLYHVTKGKKMQENITSRLKLLGRLMLTLQKKSIGSFKDALKPQNFSHIIDAVKEISGFNEELKTSQSPTLLMKLMTSLKTIGEITYARALKDNADKQIIREAETFMKLCDKEWRRLRPSRSKLSASTVPFIQDVQLLCQYMESTASSAVESLTMYECSPVYIALLRVTVAQLSILNKNMMEVSKVTVKSFNERDSTEGHGDTAEPQPQLEQILSKHYVRLKLVCNKGKEVVAVTTPQLISALTLLVSKRESCGVHANNPFLFGRPSASCSSFFYGHQCMGTCVIRCGAKNTTNLRSVFFHQHIERVFQILSLSDDELGQLAKLLGRNIRTNREYYRTPEAALDIAKILEILSAMENGSLERLEGKSLEEIEVPDILEPDGQPNVEPNEVSDAEADEEQENPENRDAEKDNELSELSLQLSGLFTFSTPKKPSRVSSSRKRGKRKTRKQESEAEPSELNDERKNEVNSERDDDEMPESCDVDTPEKTAETTEDTSKMWFSDDDDDMNVDFDIDTDDDVRNEDNDGDGDTSRSTQIPRTPVEQDTTKHDNDSSDTKKTDSPPDMDTVSDHEESKDVDEVNNVEEKDQKIRSSSSISNSEKNKKLLAAMKQVKILVRRLDIGSLRFPVRVSKLSSVCNSDNEKKESKQLYVKDQTVHDDGNKSPTPSTSTKLKDQPSSAKPLDVIMAAVDIKGTMKEFCGINCLCAFKYNTVPTQPTQTICRTCKKTCTTTCDFTLSDVLHKFCSDSCLQDFRRENVVTCANCNSTCPDKPLTLKLDGKETKSICSDECLEQIKEKITKPHKCHVCKSPQPVPVMVHYKSEEDVVKLFCNRYCLSSYKTYLGCKIKENKSSAQSKEGKRDEQSSEDGKVASDSTVNENDAESEEPLIVLAKSGVQCGQCGKELQSGQRLYQPKTSQEVFCSASCLSEWHPHLKIVQKKCHNCFQVILRPHDMILAPVDDSGTMKELCSNACLSSVNSKRNLSIPKPSGPRSECRMCGRYNWCRFELILDGLKYRLCSDACYIRYHKVNNMPVLKCNMCSSICHETRLALKTEDGGKTVCSEECLVKLKKKTEEARLCPMCQTPHQVSDMVESKNKEGKLEFFCSSRCMMVHNAQSATAPGRNSPTMEETDVKEVKPSLPNLDCIKQELIEEECNQNQSSSVPTENIKDEPNAPKEGLKIGSVFSLKGEPKATALTQDLPASCSNCKNVLMDGETVYQRKGRADIFCSTSCLLKFYQMKQAMKTCHFCLQVITQLQGVVQAPVDNEETMKDFCSETCLASFNYKKIMSTKIPVAPAGLQSQCTICSRYRTSKHEIVQHDVVHKICSDPCFLRFCNVNKLSICENCCSHCSAPVMLKMGEIGKKFCSVNCLSEFKQKYKTPQPCAMCCTPHVMTDMVENKNGENEVELFCTNSCVMASKIQAVSASGRPLNCDNCGKSTVPACHLAMSDASIRNFCTLSCAMVFKETQTATVNSTGASDQTQSDFLKPPEKLPCAQCRRILKTAPKVVQKKGKMNFVCSLACSQEFKRVNNIMGKCEYCKNEKIIRDIKRVDGRDCYFCSDGCKMLFRHELEQEWGAHCSSCAYCMSISKTLVTAKYKGTDEKFCSEDCNSKYKMLFCHIAKCDTCGHEGKLRQSLPLLGEVKHFCDLKCVLHFCNKKVQTVNADSSPPRSAGATESSPVIANVISLAGALARQSSASVSSAQQTLPSVPDIQTKVVGHASVQTVPKELKNKSMLCTPLVHNKGVSCTPQTVDTEAQTDNFVPKVVVLPLPVPVYVPMPMNMYSQYTPKPVGLPLPLPVPVFLPGTADGADPAKQTAQPDPPEEELDSKSEDEEIDKEDEHKDRAVTRKRQRKERSSDRSDDSDVDQEDSSSSDSSFGSLGPQSANEKPPLASEAGVPGELPPPATPGLVMREEEASPPLHHENEGRKLQHLSKAAEDETSQEEYHKLNSQCGIDAWKRWIQWRELQINLDLVSSHAVAVKEDVLRCSAAELNDGLCCFITEVKQPDGEPYSPDSLFYFCLSIQQARSHNTVTCSHPLQTSDDFSRYLFENGRMENIFSDLIYNKFSTGFTEILKGFRPSVTASGYGRSCVEEEFLWECKQLGTYSPIILLNTLLFFCCKHFGFTTVEQHRQLSFTHIMHCTKTNQDNSETNFLRFYVPISINEAESDGVPAKRSKKHESKYDVLEMMENTENPLRCPVRLYEFYLSKWFVALFFMYFSSTVPHSSESVKQHAGLFYLQPDRCCVPSSPLWFSSTALDSSTMEAMLVRILAVRELRGEDGRGSDQQRLK
ncbi:Zinc finger MYM-type protein 4 [Nibea albiflora]|uniref:Zinc finger MYM-type protein 4 n=1 Tax=Nibea albiflora TaxID=240163 RepID=A0ACB7ERW3_NIBAL|nr:Zinc finger MYM-type protein 4 [Nibea albiflora]